MLKAKEKKEKATKRKQKATILKTNLSLFMELGTIQTLINTAIEQIKSDQLVPFVHWLDEKLTKYRMSNLSKSTSFSSEVND